MSYPVLKRILVGTLVFLTPAASIAAASDDEVGPPRSAAVDLPLPSWALLIRCLIRWKVGADLVGHGLEEPDGIEV